MEVLYKDAWLENILSLFVLLAGAVIFREAIAIDIERGFDIRNIQVILAVIIMCIFVIFNVNLEYTDI